jgi:hypothetical protein
MRHGILNMISSDTTVMREGASTVVVENVREKRVGN